MPTPKPKKRRKLEVHPDQRLPFFNVEFTLHDGSHIEYENPKPRLGQDLPSMLVQAQDELNIDEKDVASYVFWKE